MFIFVYKSKRPPNIDTFTTRVYANAEKKSMDEVVMEATIFNIQKFCLHDGPGIRTNVFFCGCNLRCQWCSNPECQIEQQVYDLESLVQEVLKDKVFYDKSGGGVTLSGGEVLLQAEFAEAFCRRLHEEGVRVAIETAGAVSPERFQQVIRQTDFVFMDLKHHESLRHKAGTGVGNELAIQNLRWLVQSGTEYRIRIPVIPGFNDSLADAEAFCQLFADLGVAHVELLPFHQFGKGKYEKYDLPYAYAAVSRLTKEDLSDYYAIFQSNIPDVIMK